MGSAEFVPLRICAWMRTPIIADKWLPLDGLLLYQATRADLGRQDLTVPGKSLLEEPKGGPMHGGHLPLAIIHGESWFYRCSWAQWGPSVDGEDAWVKRFDTPLAYLVDFKGRRGHIEIGEGRYRAYHMPVYYRSALWVEWHCVGDREAIGALLSTALHLGKKSAQGWGRVARWEIEPEQEDRSIWDGEKLMRGLPADQDRRSCQNLAYYGIRPPYWDKRNQLMLSVP